MSEQVGAAFTKRKLDDEAIEELEDILVMSDLGYGVATKVTDRLREDKFDKQVTDLEVKIALADVISEILTAIHSAPPPLNSSLFGASGPMPPS